MTLSDQCACVEAIKSELRQNEDHKKAQHHYLFFKALPGGYGAGDRFIGVTVPVQRKIAQKYYRHIPLAAVEILLRDPFHEHRLTALFILGLRYARAQNAGTGLSGEDASQEQAAIVEMYLNNVAYINNWDLVDASAPVILGPYLMDKDKDILYNLAASGDLWKQRIAVLTTFHFIKNGRFEECLNLAESLLEHRHDLIHKAVGWMLREIGNRDFAAEYDFLQKHYRTMPRTMLRYAIEKFDESLRQKFLRGLI